MAVKACKSDPPGPNEPSAMVGARAVGLCSGKSDTSEPQTPQVNPGSEAKQTSSAPPAFPGSDCDLSAEGWSLDPT